MLRLLISALPVVLVAVSAEAADLQGHRATFNLSLQAGAAPAVGVLGIIGRMAVEFELACDGYVTRQAMQMLIRTAQGETTETRYTSTVWESKSGREMTFETAASFGNQADPPYAGRAEMGKDGGRVVYDVPGGALPLRAGTVFSSQHTELMLDAALRGERLDTHDVFDGGSPTNYATITTAFAPAKDADIPPALAGRRSWIVREARFRPGARSERPDQENGYRLFEGGMLDALDLDYGPFRVSGKLASIELLPSPRC